jgi:hypothetical protein
MDKPHSARHWADNHAIVTVGSIQIISTAVTEIQLKSAVKTNLEARRWRGKSTTRLRSAAARASSRTAMMEVEAAIEMHCCTWTKKV